MITKSTLSVIIITILLAPAISVTIEELTTSLQNIPEDGRLNFCELANKYDMDCIVHNVTTVDGYKLTLFNIPGNTSKPIYLQHGLVDSSFTFLMRGNGSLIAHLADQDYDVWAGNMRGNLHSRAHKTLNPDAMEFWDFSIHEIGTIDVATMIDYVLNKTGQERLQAIAHSEGTTSFFVLLSMRPEYNNKLSLVVCLAPVAFLHNAEQPIFPLVSLTVGPALSKVLSLFAYGEIFRNSSMLVQAIRAVCTQGMVGYTICLEGFAFPLFGRDPEQLEPDFFRVAMGHYPAGSSTRNLMHLQQIVDRRQFAQYDYGLIKNYMLYKAANPPAYNLTRITTKVVLAVGKADSIVDEEDVRTLRKLLPNEDYHMMKRKEWNHMDFVWGNDMSELYKLLRVVLHKYRN